MVYIELIDMIFSNFFINLSVNINLCGAMSQFQATLLNSSTIQEHGTTQKGFTTFCQTLVLNITSFPGSGSVFPCGWCLCEHIEVQDLRKY